MEMKMVVTEAQERRIFELVKGITVPDAAQKFNREQAQERLLSNERRDTKGRFLFREEPLTRDYVASLFDPRR